MNIKETEGINMSRDTISIHFVNAALSGVKRLGMDVETLLSHVGIGSESVAVVNVVVCTNISSGNNLAVF